MIKFNQKVWLKETRFDSSNFEIDRPSHKGKNKSIWINER